MGVADAQAQRRAACHHLDWSPARHASQPAEYEQVLAETEDKMVELRTARIRDSRNAAG
jgi:hypothetical protein